MPRNSILNDIFAHKQSEVEAAKNTCSPEQIRTLARSAPPPRKFVQALLNGSGIIAEIKRASPSKGVFDASLNPATRAALYAEGGASCLSVLTDRQYFSGSEDDLNAARDACALPVLRKDFLYCAYQVLQSRAWGADCILLIVAALEDSQLSQLHALARELGMAVLVEAHDRKEVERALQIADIELLGINNRNLHTFATDLAVSLELLPHIPAHITAVSESGIHSADDIQRLSSAGARGYLIGESLARQDDPVATLRQLNAATSPALPS